jgi:hypothetical protein
VGPWPDRPLASVRKASMTRIRSKRALAACLAASGVVALGGCGGSSKPSYCTNRANLESSIKGLTNIDPTNALSSLQSQVAKIQSDANALVSAAKSDFPNETSAIKSSVSSLSTTIKSLSSSPSAGDIATLAKQASSTVSAVQSFYNATKSKCS